jgi:hypothetical protein
MNKIELLTLLTEHAKEFRKDSGWYTRNGHMNDIEDCPLRKDIDAVLSGFINYIGMSMGVDYALYASDLKEENGH